MDEKNLLPQIPEELPLTPAQEPQLQHAPGGTLPEDVIAWEESQFDDQDDDIAALFAQEPPQAPMDGAQVWEEIHYTSTQDPDLDLALLQEEPAFETQSAELFPDPVEEIAPPVDDLFVSPQKAPAPAEEPQAEADTRPVRKGRPKRKKGDGFFGIPHLLSSLVWLAIVVAIGVTLGRLLWVGASDVLAFGREDRTVIVTIESSDTIDTITDKLYNAGLIRYPALFRLYANLTVDEGEISTGTFTLNTLYDYHALIGGMSSRSSYRSVVEDVVIPEGYNCRQIFALLEEKGICTVAELEEYAANGEFADFWFLEDVQRGDKYCLEGYLFPDTYDFYAGSTPREALGKMLTGFENRITDEMRAQLPALNERISQMMRADGRSEEYIAQNQLTFRDVVIVASLIEKETGSYAESYNIASVIYNRLYAWGNTPSYLNIDAAIIYVTGDPNNIDTSIDSPYNTYRHTGLTPGPISNPGLASLEAAMNPANTDYYFYVLNPATGRHVFSKTLAEHEKLREQFAAYTPAETSEDE